MAKFTSSRKLAESQARRFARVQRSLLIEHAQLAAEMKDIAYDLTSGGISSATLRRLGHPFGRGRGRVSKGTARVTVRGSAPRLPINVQSGQLRRSWRLIRRRTGSVQVFQLQPTSPHAIVLRPGGTRKMVARGFWTRMRAEFKRANRTTIQRMRYRALLEMRRT